MLLNGPDGQVRRAARAARGRVIEAAGGRARARVIFILAAVLALNGADQATVSATADNLERAFHLGNTGIGLLITVVALAGAAFTQALPCAVRRQLGGVA